LFEKGGVLGLEAVVETFGDAVHVECLARAGRDSHESELLLLLDLDFKGLQLLKQSLARLTDGVGVFAAGDGLARLAFDPLPRLKASAGVKVDDQVLAHAFGQLDLNAAAGLVIVGLSCARHRAKVGNHATLFGHGFERDGLVGQRERQRAAVVVPAQFVEEQALEVELVKEITRVLFVHGVAFFVDVATSPMEQMIRGSQVSCSS